VHLEARLPADIQGAAQQLQADRTERLGRRLPAFTLLVGQQQLLVERFDTAEPGTAHQVRVEHGVAHALAFSP
jgi:hypothetical protein